MTVLVAVASRYGATREIAEAIGRTLAAHGIEAEVRSVEEVGNVGRYEAVVLGSAVYLGHWLPPAKELVHRLGDALAGRPVWLFSSGPVGDPSRRLVQRMGSDPVDLPELLAQTKAREHRIFAGKLERRNLGLFQRLALTVFRGLEGDFRDWAGIETWAAGIAEKLRRER